MTQPDPLNKQEKLQRKLSTRRGMQAFKALKRHGVEIPLKVTVGRGLRLPHGSVGLVIHEDTAIGNDVRIFGGVTVGRGDQYLSRDQVVAGGGVVIEDDAIIGAGAKVLFTGGQTLVIGRAAVIGANAVVTTDVPSGEIWAGIPARFVRLNPNAS